MPIRSLLLVDVALLGVVAAAIVRVLAAARLHPAEANPRPEEATQHLPTPTPAVPHPPLAAAANPVMRPRDEPAFWEQQPTPQPLPFPQAVTAQAPIAAAPVVSAPVVSANSVPPDAPRWTEAPTAPTGDSAHAHALPLPFVPADLYADPVDGMPFESGEVFALCLCGTGYREATREWLVQHVGGCCVKCQRVVPARAYRLPAAEDSLQLAS